MCEVSLSRPPSVSLEGRFRVFRGQNSLNQGKAPHLRSVNTERAEARRHGEWFWGWLAHGFIHHLSTPGGRAPARPVPPPPHRLSVSSCLRALRVNRPEADTFRMLGWAYPPSRSQQVATLPRSDATRRGGAGTARAKPPVIHKAIFQSSSFHLHPDLEKVIVLRRRCGYLNPVSRHQRSPGQQRKFPLGFFFARQFRSRRDPRRSVNHRNRRGKPVRFIRRVRSRHVVVPHQQGLSRGILLAGRLEERGRKITAKLRLIGRFFSPVRPGSHTFM